MSEQVLNLPVDLKERREMLENELKKTVTELISQQLANDLKVAFEEYKLTGEVATISWEFHPESDDEGGTDWHPSYFTLEIDGEDIEMEEISVNKKSKWSESYYDYTLDEEVHELIYDWKDDLYKNNIEKIVVKIGE